MRNKLRALKQIKPLCDAANDKIEVTSSFERTPIKPLIRYNKLTYTHTDFNRLRVKRGYFGKLRIDCNNIYFYISNPHELSKLSKYSKYTKGLEVYAILFSHKVSLVSLYKLMRRLTRLTSVQLHFGIVYLPQSESEILRIRNILSKIRAHLTHFFAEVHISNGANAILSWFVRSIIQTVRPMMKLRSIRVQLPKLAAKLGTIFNQQDDPQDQSEALVRLYQNRFQRLTRLEEVYLPFLVSYHPMLTCFTQKFSHLSRLRNLEIVSYDILYGKAIAEDLTVVKMLSSLIVYHCLEPADALKLMSELPLLTKFSVKDDWIFTISLTPTSTPYKHIQANNIETLSLNFPMEITNEDDAKLFANFLKMFKKLKSLKAYICCEGSINFLNPLLKAICALDNLRGLELGLFLRSGKVLSLLLKGMYNITKLNRVSLTMKLSYGSIWEQTIDVTFRALEGFLKRNQELKQCELFWEKFTPRCAEYIADLMTRINRLEFLKLVYVSQYRDHGQAHDQMTTALEKMLKKANNLEKVTILTSCPSHLYKGCEGRGKSFRESIASNKTMSGFQFEVLNQVCTPFYNDQLLFY